MTSSMNSTSIFTVIRGLPKCLKRIQTFAYLLRLSLRGLFSLRIQLFMFLEIYDISSPPDHCWLPFDLLSLRAGPTHLDQWELSNTSGMTLLIHVSSDVGGVPWWTESYVLGSRTAKPNTVLGYMRAEGLSSMNHYNKCLGKWLNQKFYVFSSFLLIDYLFYSFIY